MNTKQRYNQLINEIEAQSENRHLSVDEVMHSVAQSRGFSPRELSTLIRYLTGKSLINYIKHRKVMASYKTLTEAKKCDIPEAIAVSGLGSHSALIKKYQAVFGMAPKEAFNKKDKSLIDPPATWEIISGETGSFADERSENSDTFISLNIASTAFSPDTANPDDIDHTLDKELSDVAEIIPAEEAIPKDLSLSVPPQICDGDADDEFEIADSSDQLNATLKITDVVDEGTIENISQHINSGVFEQSSQAIPFDNTDSLSDDFSKSGTKFGLPKEQFEKVLLAYELEKLYDLPAMFSELAFTLSEELGKSLKETFSFANSLYEYGGNFDDIDPDENLESDPQSELNSYAYNPYYQFAFFECRIPVSIASDLEFDRLPLSTEEILKQDPKMLHSYACTEDYIEFWYFKKAYEYYMGHVDDSYTEENFDEYIDALASDVPIEIAFANIIPGAIWDDIEDCVNDYLKQNS